MDAALLDVAGVTATPAPQIDAARVRDIVLFRVAFAGRAVVRDGLGKEIAPILAHLVAAEAWKAMLDRDLAALADAGLIDLKPSSVTATDAGTKRASMILGGRGAPPRTWAEARDIRLVAKALGLENEPPSRLKALAKPDGLRAALVVKSFGLKIKGVPSNTRLRAALARTALARAFGSQMKTGNSGKAGLSPKAARALAGQLAKKPQDFRTDGRLIAALAADYLGASLTDHAALQLAVLRRYVTKGNVADLVAPAPKKKRKAVRSLERRAKAHSPASATTAAAPPNPQLALNLEAAPMLAPRPPERPNMAAFVATVQTKAHAIAEGWTGNRKAFISRVCQALLAEHPEWGLTAIEFKCMLTEAHRLGQLHLANADLKDGRNLKDIQDSAVAYRNAVFHFVRVDD